MQYRTPFASPAGTVFAVAQRATAAKAAFVVLAIYLLWPTWFSVHAEGFSAQIEIAALAAQAGQLDRSNVLYPLHAEYFYLSRAGVVFVLQALMAVTGITSDLLFRLLTLVSFAAMGALSVVIARRRGGVGAWWGAAALLLTPAIAELGFYFNDNVVSAVFALLGLALLPTQPAAGIASAQVDGRRSRWALWAVWALSAFGSGMALAMAVLCRPDALLLGAAFAGFIWLDARSWPVRIAAAAHVAAGFGFALLLADVGAGITLLQSLHVGQVFQSLHNFRRPLIDYPSMTVIVFGLPQLVLLPVGAVLQWRNEAGDAADSTARNARLLRRLVLVVLPTLMLCYFVLHALQTRHFYPLLAPFIALHGGRGLRWLVSAADSERGRLQRRLVVALLLVVLVTPPVNVRLADGPRTIVGRLWSPMIWRDWQQAVDGDLADVQHVIDLAETVPTLTVITANYNTDHYLRLFLWQRGYRPFRADEEVAGCSGGFEAWRNPAQPGRRLLHVRTENAHVNQRPLAYTEALQMQRAFACPPVLRGTPVVVSSLGPYNETEVFEWLAKVQPAAGKFVETFGWRLPALERFGLWLSGPQRAWFGVNTMARNRTVRLTDSEIAGLAAETDRVVAEHIDDVPAYARTYDGLMGLYVARVAWPKVVDGHTVWTKAAPAAIPLPKPPKPKQNDQGIVGMIRRHLPLEKADESGAQPARSGATGPATDR